jgi:benzoyl-CoA 2,3-dioxygenase component A
LQKVPASVLDQELVFSRTGGSEAKEYVQDRIRTRAADVSVLLSDSKTHVYICGLKGMEDGVEEAFADSCADAGFDWNELRSVMREEGRYHVETY